MAYKIINGDCIEILKTIEENSIDSICTDYPYALSMMNRDWDTFESLKEYQEWVTKTAVEIYRVAKPGAYFTAFGGSRTAHRLACGIEDAGFNIRDTLLYLYGSGFPKSHRVDVLIDKFYGKTGHLGKAVRVTTKSDDEQANLEKPQSAEEYNPKTIKALKYKGYGLNLKPAVEPIVLAQKPISGSSVAENIIKYGTGALNIDDCKIRSEDEIIINRFRDGAKPFGGGAGHEYESIRTQNRWPANLLLDEKSAEILEEDIKVNKPELEGASRWFFTSKASRQEKELGLQTLPRKKVKDGRKSDIDNPYQRGETKRLNTCISVKPLDLMRWLCRLITSSGGIILDPFCGSGTTLMAARIEGFHCIGIEIDPEMYEIAKKRVAYAGIEAGNATEQDADEIGTKTQLGLFGKVDE